MGKNLSKDHLIQGFFLFFFLLMINIGLLILTSYMASHFIFQFPLIKS